MGSKRFQALVVGLRASRLRIAGVFVVTLLASAHAGRADTDEIAVPVSVQYPLMLKILQFDRNLRAHVGERIVIGVIYQGRSRTSLRTKDEFVKAHGDSGGTRVAGTPVDVVAIDIEETSLVDAFDSLEIDVVYLTPLRAVDIATITALTRERGITSMTGVESYVRAGVSVGVGLAQEKPKVIVHLDGSIAEGADYSSQLLSLALVVK